METKTKISITIDSDKLRVINGQRGPVPLSKVIDMILGHVMQNEDYIPSLLK